MHTSMVHVNCLLLAGRPAPFGANLSKDIFATLQNYIRRSQNALLAWRYAIFTNPPIQNNKELKRMACNSHKSDNKAGVCPSTTHVTQGPLPASKKVYISDLNVPMREITLTNDETFTVYDCSWPLTRMKMQNLTSCVACRRRGLNGSWSAVMWKRSKAVKSNRWITAIRMRHKCSASGIKRKPAMKNSLPRLISHCARERRHECLPNALCA